MAFSWNWNFNNWLRQNDAPVDASNNFLIDSANWIGDTFFGGSHEVNQTNERIANQNIAFQQRENEITRMREDNAVQRAAADMSQAGFSKTLAAGNPASAQALTAPSNSYQMQKNVAGMNALNAMVDLYFKGRDDKRAQNLNDANIRNIDADTQSKLISNEGLRDRLAAEETLKIAQSEQVRAQIELFKTQNELETIVKNNKQKEIDSIINKNIADYYETLSRTTLNNKELELMAENIKKTVLEQVHLEWLNDEEKHKVELLVEDIAYKKLQNQELEYNLDFSKKNNLRTSDSMSRLFGFNVENLDENLAQKLKEGWHDLWTPIWEWSFFK